jgi:hypothetical protein
MVRSAPDVLWRVWAFVASAPLGWLGVQAGSNPADLVTLAVGIGAAGLLGVALASLAARLGDHSPDRAAHVARGVSAGLAAIPIGAAAALELGPPASVWLLLAVSLLLATLWRASRTHGPGPHPFGIALAAGLAMLVGTIAVVVVPIAYGLFSAAPTDDESARDASLDIDSRVPLQPQPGCAPRAEGFEVLADRGAAPRLGRDGETVWFEARSEDGRFQVYRLRPGEPPDCWTCDEPGNNRRPAPHPFASSVLFDSDRFATGSHPNDTEVMVSRVGRDDRRRHPARRLTHRPGPDDHAFYDPSGTGFVWSSGGGGRFDVLRAAVQSGHGGLVLSPPIRLARARVSWIVPLAWGRDARTLVVARGQPLAPLVGERIDPATGEHLALGGGLVPGSASLSADGTQLALATTEPVGATRLLPWWLGNLVARWPGAIEPRGLGTSVRLGDVTAELHPVELGSIARWGMPTGIALAPGARSFVLGQRGPGGERIVRVALACGS